MLHTIYSILRKDIEQMNEKEFLFAMTKVVTGQAIDAHSPQLGLAYHIAASVTAKNDVDLLLGLLGGVGSYQKICEQNNRKYL